MASTLTHPVPGYTDTEAQLEQQQLEARVHGQYQVVRELGRGGMGVVFLARDLALHRTVAIKVLRSEFVDSEDHRERFRREARLAARLTHPGIVPVYTFGESPDLVYIVMQYVEGRSLTEWIRTSGRLPHREAARLLCELADTLAYAHGEGIVHRDLKAENVLIERRTGRALLTDFGVARLRDASPDEWERMHTFATPHYMSPEQALGEPDVDGRSDLYSLGVLGYFMLSGRLPFDGPSVASLTAQHVVNAPPSLHELAPHAPERLVRAIEQCLAKEREQRWESAGKLRDALRPVRPWLREAWNSAGRIGPWGWVKVATGIAALAGAALLVVR